MNRVTLCLTLLLLLALSKLYTRAATFQGLGDFPGGEYHSNAFDVSADGSVVVGRGWSDSGAEAFRWTAGGGMVALGDLPGGSYGGEAHGVSADGAVIVGLGSSASGQETFRWNAVEGMVGLGDLPAGDYLSQAWDVSADGSVIVGRASSSSGREGFRWTAAAGMVGLGDLPDGSFDSIAWGVSADGSVILGQSASSSGVEAFRWTIGDGMVGLGDLPGGGYSSCANASSADGSIVVGRGDSASGMEAFGWTAAEGMVGLGDLPGGGFASVAQGVSADGAVIVGYGTSASGQEAFIWDSANGMRSLKDLLAVDYGLNLDGWTLTYARAVTPNGRGIVGFGTNPSGNTEGWRVLLDPLKLYWSAVAGGTWDNTENWDFCHPATYMTEVFIEPETGLTVTGPAAATTVQSLTLGAQTSGAATLQLQSSGPLSITGGLAVGGPGGAALNVPNGASLTSGEATIAAEVGSSGSVNLDGAGSTWTGTGSVYVGGSATAAGGAGMLTVDNDATVNVAEKLKVWDTGQVDLNDGLIVADEVELAGGTFGTASGSTLRVNTLTGFGDTPSFSGSLEIGHAGGSGSGSHAVGTGESLSVAEDLVVGYDAPGELTIQNDAQVTTGLDSYIGHSSGSHGTATVDGPGSLWHTDRILYLGYYGSGELAISGGATVSTGGGYNMLIGVKTTGTGNLSVDGDGTTCDVAQDFFVGFEGSGELAVTGAGTMLVGEDAQIGEGPVASGTVSIDGDGSACDVVGNFFVGNQGIGELDITAGGTLSNGHDGCIAYGSTGQGAAIVDGTGSAWNVGNSLCVGGSQMAAGGTGTLTVQNDGAVNVTDTLKVWNTGTVELLGSQIDTGSFIVEPGGILTHQAGTLTVDGGTFDPGPGTFTLDGAGNPTLNLINGASGVLAGDVNVGDANTGTLNITGGATLSNGQGTIAAQGVSSGSVAVDGSGSAWSCAGDLCVGQDGIAVLAIADGGQVSAANGCIGQGSGSHGTLSIGSAASFAASGDLRIGQEGTGAVTQSGGTSTVAQDLCLGHTAGGSGTCEMTGGELSAGDVYLGGSDQAAGGSGTLGVDTAATVDIAGKLKLWSGGTVNLNGGTINLQTLEFGSGQFNFNAGTVNFSGDLIAKDGLVADLLGSGHTVSVGRHLSVTGTATLQTGLYLDGGTLSVGELVNPAALQFDQGTLNLTGCDLTIGSGGLLGSTLQLGSGQHINVVGNTMVAASGRLELAGGSFGGGGVANSGLITGQGEVGAPVDCTGSGEIRAGEGDHLVFTAAGNTNSGQIKLRDGIVEFTENLTNAPGGFISGRGELTVRGGLVNNGTMALSGGFTDIYGDVSNDDLDHSHIVISGGGTTTFYDDVHNDAELRISAGCAAVFFGELGGTGGTTGSGTAYIEGDLRPGNSPAVVSFGGDVVFGPAAALEIELADPADGPPNDRIDVAGNVYLDGTLTVEAISNLGAVGDSTYTIITAAGPAGVVGSFAHVPEVGDYYANPPTQGTYLGYGTWFGNNKTGEGVTYVGAPGVVTAVDVAVFQAKRGDATGDRKIDFSDFVAMFNNWTGSVPPPGMVRDWRQADFSGDNKVDFSDFVPMFNNWTGSGTEYGTPPGSKGLGGAKDPPVITLKVYLADAWDRDVGRVTAGTCVMVGDPYDLSGYSVDSASGSLVPDADRNASPLQFCLSNNPQEITAGNIPSAYAFPGALKFDWGFDVGLEGEQDLVFRYGPAYLEEMYGAVVYIVPEPGTLGLLACGGLAALVLVIGRRRRAA